MIFSCGITWEEEKRRRGEWHDFFPLFPRTIRIENGRVYCAWLQTIQRRSWYESDYFEAAWHHEYRLKPDEHGRD